MMTPPKADKRPYPMTRHGDTRVDDYTGYVMMNVQMLMY